MIDSGILVGTYLENYYLLFYTIVKSLKFTMNNSLW